MTLMPASRLARLALFLVSIATAGPVTAGSLTYAAREGSAYAGDQLASDTGGPTELGQEGDLFEQLRSYSPFFQGIFEEQTVFWDDNTEQLVGFTENAASLPYTALATESVTWKFSSGAWGVLTTVTTSTTGTTGVVERSPLISPLIPPPGGGGGGDGTALTDLEIQELEMAGVDYAMRQYLDPNYSLAGITREQLAADLQRLEAILAGYYTPDVPEPAPVALMAMGGLLAIVAAKWRIGRRTTR